MDRDIRERLDRIERKLFPENLRMFYDFQYNCSNENCKRHYENWHESNVLENPITNKLNKCKICGRELIISDIHEHKEIVFED